MKLNLGLIFGGRSGEHEVSLQSARSITNNVDTNKYNLHLIAMDKSGNWYLADENHYLNNADDPSAISLNIKSGQQVALIPLNNSNSLIRLSDNKKMTSLDVVFPIIHGTYGEDGCLQGYMAILNIPCVGADVLGSAIGMDKLITKELLMKEGIPVANYFLIESSENLDKTIRNIEKKFDYPVFVKPASSGSSVGVYKANNRDALIDSVKKALRFDRRILIEEAIQGREIECAILGNTELIASVPGEIIPRHEFYSYEAKYIDIEGAQLDAPANIPFNTATRIQELAKKAYKVLSCSGMARVDMFLKPDGELVMNEINTLPGFTKISMYPRLMELSGIPYKELIDRLISLAFERHNQQEQFLQHVLQARAY
jgi:D-alanine-D-alanine ligase